MSKRKSFKQGLGNKIMRADPFTNGNSEEEVSVRKG